MLDFKLFMNDSLYLYLKCLQKSTIGTIELIRVIDLFLQHCAAGDT